MEILIPKEYSFVKQKSVEERMKFWETVTFRLKKSRETNEYYLEPIVDSRIKVTFNKTQKLADKFYQVIDTKCNRCGNRDSISREVKVYERNNKTRRKT